MVEGDGNLQGPSETGTSTELRIAVVSVAKVALYYLCICTGWQKSNLQPPPPPLT